MEPPRLLLPTPQSRPFHRSGGGSSMRQRMSLSGSARRTKSTRTTPLVPSVATFVTEQTTPSATAVTRASRSCRDSCAAAALLTTATANNTFKPFMAFPFL